METKVNVDLGTRSYDIVIGQCLLRHLGDYCEKLKLGKRCLVITDSNVEAHYASACLKSLEIAGIDVALAVIPAGEESKSHDSLIDMYDHALAHHLDRHSFIVALGGGVVGDLAGYTAAAYLRGIPFVQVPTTLLAMVDSAVGGKTGINMPQGKNLIGAFHQPALVLADLELLKTLPPREFSAGMAEVVKYGVIYDEVFFAWLEENLEAIQALDANALTHVVQRSCEIKAEVVNQDEREGGLRAILNYGHTLGHALEQVTAYGHFLHGEAIAIGMVYASRLSEKLRGLEPAATERQIELFKRLSLPVEAQDMDWDELRSAMSIDKKSIGSIPRFVLADKIGLVTFGREVSEEDLVEAWRG